MRIANRSPSSWSFCVLAICVFLSGTSQARVIIIARPGPAGPAASLAGEQIAHWPTRSTLQILDHDPDTLPTDTSLILELTEDFDFHANMPMAGGATIRVIASAAFMPHAKELAQSASAAVNREIDAADEKFQIQEVAADDQAVPRIVITTSTREELTRQRISKRSRQHRIAVREILEAEKVIDGRVTASTMTGAPPNTASTKPAQLRVAYYDDIGARSSSTCNPVWVRQSMRDVRDFDVYLISAQDIRDGALKGQFDVLIMGGGTAKTEGATLGSAGREAIRSYVEQGGGYVGICAGAFLGARNAWGLSIAAVKTRPTNAIGELPMAVSDDICKRTDFPSPRVTATFHGGPILSLTEDAEQFGAQVWATFKEDLHRGNNTAADEGAASDEPLPAAAKVPLKDTPAIISCRFGKGRTVLLAPHCERVSSNQSLFWSAVRWAGNAAAEQEREIRN